MQPNTPGTVNTPSAQPGAMSLFEHLKELRVRLTYAMIGVAVGTVVGFYLVLGPIGLIEIIIRAFTPINPNYAPLQAVGTVETFASYMTVALGVGFIFSMPIIVYQIIGFVAPGLTPAEKRFVFMALPFVTGFFLFGVAFGWFITVPAAIHFLIGFGQSELIAVQPAISDFLRTVTLLLLINGIVFELPIVIFVLAYLNITTPQQLSQYRRYAIVVVAIVAAIITPTGDPINLLLLAVPMYLLYELGIIFAYFAPKR